MNEKPKRRGDSPEPDEDIARVPPSGAPPVAVAADQAPWPRQYAILSEAGLIGFTNLEYRLGGHRAAGKLELADGYAGVRDIFAMYRKSGGDSALLREYVQKRDQLGLVLTDGGTLPFAARVELISEWRPTQVVIHVSIQDERFWRQPSAF